jgi:titin
MSRPYARLAAFFAALLLVGPAAGVVLAVPASAAPSCTTTCFVNGATGSDSNSGTTAGTALATVNAALTQVSAGGTIVVAAGTYTEQLVVNKAVTITGAGQATTIIQGPSTLADSSCIPLTSGQPTRAVVTLCGSSGSTVVMNGLTISGGAAGADASSSCNPLITGVWVSDNDTLNISQSTVTNVYNSAGPSTWGCQQGIGIRAGSNFLGLVGHLIADHLTVLRYQKGGINVDGPGSSATITNSTVQGDQLAGLSPTIAMNGIQIGRGASGSISGTAVSGNECDHPSCGADPLTQTQSVGILLFDFTTSPVANVSATGNNVTGNDIGIYTSQLQGLATLSGNTVNANRYEGVLLDEGTALVTNNAITNNGSVPFGAGVFAVQGSSSAGDTTATLTGNTISGNPQGVEISDVAVDAFTTHFQIHRNALTGNPTFGVDNLAASVADATCNWWGAANGPGPVGLGSGDKVSTAVTFAGWLLTSNLTGGCPVPPTINSVTSAGPTSVSVSFTPGNNGGSPFTSFTATCTGLIGQPVVTPVTGGGSPIVVTGLATGTPYVCTVTETNGVGTSDPSAPSNVIWPGASGGGGGGGHGCTSPLTAPTTPSSAPGNASATVSWGPPPSGCFEGYVVHPYIGTAPQTPVVLPGFGTTTVVKGLTNGQTYKFAITAYSGNVEGPASVFTTPITVGAPAASSAAKVTRIASRALKVAFTAPPNNGAAIKAYTATCRSTNGGVPKAKTAKASPIIVSGLSAGKTYTCTVKATNSRGTGPASRASKPARA